MYCLKNEKLKSLMIEICKLDSSIVYLNRDQKHKGRVIVALNEHKNEIFEIEENKRNLFFKEVSMVSSALKKIYNPQKINYAIYGDLVQHVHFHIVPKYKDGLHWGVSFKDNVEKEYLLEDEYDKMVYEIKNELLKVK